jgi:glycosyltransferase involved in cell wall biosynthesis
MKIAYIIPSLANTGPVIVVKELVTQMTAHYHQCTVFYFDNKREVDFDCPVQQIEKNEKINFTQYHIVHSHGLRPDKYVWKYRETSGQTKYISTIHNYVIPDLKSQYNPLIAQVFGNLWMKRWLKRHDRIVVLSRDAMKYYRRWFSPAKLTYAYNTRNPDTSKTLNSEELSEVQQFKQDSTLIGINALLTPRKGIDIIIKALPKLCGYKLFVVGTGKSHQKLERLAVKLGVANRCYFAGYRANAYRYLPFYDVFAMPSRSEGFPLALLEAAIYHRGIVVSNIPVFKELFSDCAMMFDLAHPTSIVQAVIKATGNTALENQLFEKYKTCYSPEKMYQQYLQIYQEVFV